MMDARKKTIPLSKRVMLSVSDRTTQGDSVGTPRRLHVSETRPEPCLSGEVESRVAGGAWWGQEKTVEQHPSWLGEATRSNGGPPAG